MSIDKAELSLCNSCHCMTYTLNDKCGKCKKDKMVCSICGKPMINVRDKVTKKINPYLWETTCEHLKGRKLSSG